MEELPDFNDNPSNTKNETLTQANVDQYRCHPILVHLLEQTAREQNKTPEDIRVLDYGCGRGEMVAYLRQLGYDCYGVEIGPSYIKHAQAYFGLNPAPFPIVSLLKDGRCLFPDGFFDVVVTDQVFEHVSDMDSVMAELSRIIAVDAKGLHIFPSAFSLVEPHMLLPFVHWLPKGRVRHTLIRAMLMLGMGAPYFTHLSAAERASIFFQFSISDTFYRTQKRLTAFFNYNGFSVSGVVREKLLYRGGFVAKVVAIPLIGTFAAWLYGTFYQTYLLTTKNHPAQSIFHSPS